MSLSLKDVKGVKKKPTGEAQKPKYPPGAWAARTARPWTEESLAKHGSTKKRSTPTDATMNEEWINLHAAPLFWIDFTNDSGLARFHIEFGRVEEKIQAAIIEPLKALRKFFRKKA